MTHFGVQLHGTFPMGRYPQLAQLVERYEFTELTIHDVVWWRPVWPILALVAQATERVLVGPDVTNPYIRHPADTASCIAAIDELSGGRAILGLAAGQGFQPLGIEQERPRDAVRECAALVNRYLAGDREAHDGDVFHVSSGAEFRWEPVRSSIPIFVGAYGPKMIEAASQWVDEIRPPAVWDPRFFEDVKGRVQAAAGAAGREVPVGCDLWLAMDEDRDRARQMGRSLLSQFLAMRQFKALSDFYDVDPEEVAAVRGMLADGDREGAARMVSDATLDRFVAAGDPSDIAAGLATLVELGISTITFSGRLGIDPAKAIEVLGETVLPRVRAEFGAAAGSEAT